MNLKNLSNKELLTSTKNLVSKEREILTEVLHHLREIQTRRLFCDLGYSSLYAYCTGELKYSEPQADRRIQAMRLLAELPQIETKVANGELSLSNLAAAKRHFRQEEKLAPVSAQEKLQVLRKLENKTSREGEKILLKEASVPPAPVREKMRQVTAEVTEIKFGADEKLLAKMKRLKGLMSHRKPNMSLQEFMDEPCEIALEQLDLVCKPVRKMPKVIPSAPKVNANGRQYISVNLNRQVWKNAKGACENCGSEFHLEIDHIIPVTHGGNSELSNLRLLCRNCNQRAAILKLGDKLMQKYLEGSP